MATSEERGDEAEMDQEVETEIVAVTIVLPSGDRIAQQVARNELAQDLRVMLQENARTATLTAYHLEYQGKTVNEQLEFSAIEGLTEEAEFAVVEDEYDDRTARGHVFRLRELLDQSPSATRAENPSVLSLLANPKIEFEGYSGVASEKLILTDYLPAADKPPACVKQLAFSGWNPPPAARRLAGDLFYLDVKTLEGVTFYVTAWTNGFYVNNTKIGGVFDPSPAGAGLASHNLAELLSKLSPRFSQGFAQLISAYFDGQSLDYIPSTRPVVPWLAHKEDHQHDVHRAEMDTIQYHVREITNSSRQREWASELRLFRDMPSSSLFERMNRDRQMYHLHSSFIAVALEGAVNIMEGSITPLNPFEERSTWVYFYNNIFYSFTVDQKDSFKSVGGDIGAYRSASHELLSSAVLNKHDIKGLHTSLTLVVDYLGQRLLCQGLLPGFYATITEGVQPNIVYGTNQENKPLEKVEPKFKELMAEFAKTLNAKTHKVKDEHGNVFEVEFHYDIKGILATDERRYVMEMNRVTPRDLNYTSGPEDATYVLRPELVSEYQSSVLYKTRLDLESKVEALLKEDPELEKMYSDIVRVHDGEIKEEDAVSLKNLTPALQEKRQKIVELISTKFIPPGPYNLDVGNPRVTLAGTDEENTADTEAVKKLAVFLKEVVIPRLSVDLLLKNIIPTDGGSLKEILHERGVNMRYLGTVALALKEAIKGEVPEWLSVIFEREMVVRSVKYIFSQFLKETKPAHLSLVVSQLLNALFGRPSNNTKGSPSGVGAKPFEKPVPKSRSQKLSQSRDTVPVATPTHDQLWLAIRLRVLSKFGYTLPELLSLDLFALPTLRAVCLRVGIQLQLREYDLSREHIFTPEDITRLFPVIKDVEPTSSDAQELIFQGQLAMREGRPDLAYGVLQDARTLFTNVHGPIHKSVANVLMNLARVAQRSEQTHEALDHLERAVVISERALGLDHYDVVHSYVNLAVVLQSVESNKTALNYFRRALYLSELIGGRSSPELVGSYVNMASMLQDLTQFAQATTYLRKALALSERLLGPLHPETGSCLHALALNLTVLGEFREALAAETRHYEISKALYGDSHQQTIDSNLTLKTITTSAVTVAKAQQGAKKQQRLPNARTKTIAEQSAAVNQMKSSLSEVMKRAESMGLAPGSVTASASAKTQRNRVTIAQGSSWRGKKASPASSTSSSSNSGEKKQGQQQQQQQGKKGKKSGK